MSTKELDRAKKGLSLASRNGAQVQATYVARQAGAYPQICLTRRCAPRASCCISARWTQMQGEEGTPHAVDVPSVSRACMVCAQGHNTIRQTASTAHPPHKSPAGGASPAVIQIKEDDDVIWVCDEGPSVQSAQVGCKRPCPDVEVTPCDHKVARRMIQDKGPPCPSDAHGKVARQVGVINDIDDLMRFRGKKPRPTAEQPSGGKDAHAGATSRSLPTKSKKPSDPLFDALRPTCMRQTQHTQLPPFTNVLQLHQFMQDPGLILDHLPDCWNAPTLDAGCSPAAFAAFAETVGTPDRIAARWQEMQRLIANIKIDDFEDVEDTQRFVALVVFAALGGAFHVPRSQAVDFEALKKQDPSVPMIVIFMHFPTRFPGSAETLLGLGDPSHKTFCGFKVNEPRADGYKEECSHQVWELVKLLLGPKAWTTVIALDLMPLSCWANAGKCCGLGGESSIIDDFWRSLPRSFHKWYAQYAVQMIERLAQASSVDAANARATLVVGTGHACREIIQSPNYRPLATLQGVSNVHMANKGSDGQSKFQWIIHISCITRVQNWHKMIGDPTSGTAQLAKLVRLAKSTGGELQGQVVESAFKALATAQTKETGNARADIIVQYVRDCWVRGSSLGGHGGQKMWNFDYLLHFTQRTASSFCDDPRTQKILARAKYQHGLHHEPSSHNNVGEVVSELNSATPEFISLFTAKIACLEEYGSKTRWKTGQSGNVDTQFKPGESGNKATQFKPGESSSKATQWVSCGRFGVKGKAEHQ